MGRGKGQSCQGCGLLSQREKTYYHSHTQSPSRLVVFWGGGTLSTSSLVLFTATLSSPSPSAAWLRQEIESVSLPRCLLAGPLRGRVPLAEEGDNNRYVIGKHSLPPPVAECLVDKSSNQLCILPDNVDHLLGSHHVPEVI